MKKLSLHIFIFSVFILFAGLMPDSALAANYTPACGNACVGTFTATPSCGETWTMTVNNVTIGRTEPACASAVNGSCGTTNGSCSTGVIAPGQPVTQSDGSTHWYCNGQNGGVNSPLCWADCAGTAFGSATDYNGATAGCGAPPAVTPTGTWTAPTCPTACGTAASNPAYYCSGGNGLCSTNSPATRSCAATAACDVNTIAQPTNQTHSCNAAGTQVTLSWSAVSGATAYPVRVDDLAGSCNGSVTGPASYYCYNGTEYINDGLTSTSITVNITPGKSYSWWVHALKPTNIWSTNSVNSFNCSVSTYTYSYNSNGGTPAYSSVTGVSGATVNNPGSPTRSGYAFSGWSPSLPRTMPVGGGSSVAQWTAIATAPGLTLTASPTSITVGNSSTLTWTVTGTADSCWASNGWTGWKTFTAGSHTQSVSPGVTTTYSLECWNAGVSSGMRNVTVNAISNPNCLASTVSGCSRSNTVYGGTSGSCTSTYFGTCSYTCGTGGTWGSPSSNACAVRPGLCGSVNGGSFYPAPSSNLCATVYGSTFTDSVGIDGTYNWRCYNALGNLDQSCSATKVIVDPVLTASSRRVNAPSNVTFTWDLGGYTSGCTLTGGTLGTAYNNLTTNSIVPSAGQTINAKTTYTLTCGARSDKETIEIVPIGFES